MRPAQQRREVQHPPIASAIQCIRHAERIQESHSVFLRIDNSQSLPFHAHVLGFGSFYNHANPANLYYEKDRKNLQMRFFAVDAVARGTELTINYNAEDGGPSWDDDYWFEEMNIRRL